MTPKHLSLGLALLAALLLAAKLEAQDMKLEATPQDKEAFYTEILERRVTDILTPLDIKDAARASRVHDLLTLHYRSLRMRDEVIRARLEAEQKAGTVTDTRAGLLRQLSKPLHEWFVGVLALDLSPEQLEKVKDKMTYNKVQVTFNAYCDIVPKLTDPDKAKVLELLKAAREEAMDGGSAGEKSEIFQKYKDQINAYLDANGHNVAQAYKDWDAKHPTAHETSASAQPAGN